MDRYKISEIYEEYADFSVEELVSPWDDLDELDGIELNMEKSICRLQEEASVPA